MQLLQDEIACTHPRSIVADNDFMAFLVHTDAMIHRMLNVPTQIQPVMELVRNYLLEVSVHLEMGFEMIRLFTMR